MFVAPAPRRVVVAVAIVAGAMVGAGCSTHRVATSHPCPVVSKTRVVAAPDRGAVGMARISITPARLKAQMKCDS